MAKDIIIKNAKVITMAEQNFENAYIMIKNGKIEYIGTDEKKLEDGIEVFDASGLTAVPGFVDAHSHIGIFGDGIGWAGMDGNECTDPVTPELRAIDAINPFDRCFGEAIEGGVTTVVTGPGSANVIGGQFVAMKTFGKSVDEMAFKEPAALKCALGENPKNVYGNSKRTPQTRMATAAILRQAFIDAENYRNEMFSDKPPKRSLKNEILVKALNKEIPVKFHAHRADDIMTAIRIAKEFDLEYSLDHCTEGYLIPEQLKESGARIIVGPLVCERSKVELANLTIEAPSILHENGVEFALMTDNPVISDRYLQLCAQLISNAGLPREEALKSITINAAKAAFIEEYVGSLETGKDGDVLLFAGEPLDINSRLEAVFIEGNRVK
ncbi:MAG: amidohydrolase [Christensenellaceae bacterium]|nr:amidohydrolase [Christensenellaceae bacterium]